jgi:hypothetical protein
MNTVRRKSKHQCKGIKTVEKKLQRTVIRTVCVGPRMTSPDAGAWWSPSFQPCPEGGFCGNRMECRVRWLIVLDWKRGPKHHYADDDRSKHARSAF